MALEWTEIEMKSDIDDLLLSIYTSTYNTEMHIIFDIFEIFSLFLKDGCCYTPYLQPADPFIRRSRQNQALFSYSIHVSSK